MAASIFLPEKPTYDRYFVAAECLVLVRTPGRPRKAVADLLLFVSRRLL